MREEKQMIEIQLVSKALPLMLNAFVLIDLITIFL